MALLCRSFHQASFDQGDFLISSTRSKTTTFSVWNHYTRHWDYNKSPQASEYVERSPGIPTLKNIKVKAAVTQKLEISFVIEEIARKSFVSFTFKT